MERKLTAIMAADVVGYSRLMGADEAGAHDRGELAFHAPLPILVFLIISLLYCDSVAITIAFTQPLFHPASQLGR